MWTGEALHSFSERLQTSPVPGPEWGCGWRCEVIGHVCSLKGYVLWRRKASKYILSEGDGAVKRS